MIIDVLASYNQAIVPNWQNIWLWQCNIEYL